MEVKIIIQKVEDTIIRNLFINNTFVLFDSNNPTYVIIKIPNFLSSDPINMRYSTLWIQNPNIHHDYHYFK